MANALTKIKADALTADLIDETKLADNSIDSEHYNDGSIDNAHLADDAVGTAEIADDAVTQALIADNAVGLAQMAGGTDGQIITYDASGDPVAVGPGTDGQVLTSTGAGSPPAFEDAAGGQVKNLVINGACNIAQRATSKSTHTGHGYFTVDRFYTTISGEDEGRTENQITLTSSDTGPWAKGFRKAFQITNGNQTSGAGASDNLWMIYKVEAQDMASCGWDYTSTSSYITCSFWVKSSVAQNFYGYFKTPDSNHYYTFETGSLSANTWTKITKTLPGNSNLTINSDTGDGFQFNLDLFRGTTWTGTRTLNTWSAWDANARTPNQTSTWWTTNDATFAITGLQIEIGATANDFQHKSFGEELLDCQRYYEKTYAYGTAPGTATDTNRRLRRTQASASSGTQFTNEEYQVRKRATPTITTYSTDGTSGEVFIANYGISGSHVSSSTYGASDNGFEVLTGTVTANAIGGFWTADAEL